jgi:DME family drug/metabolite transporter
VAYTLYFRGLRTAAPSTAALLALLEPLTGAVLAALILGDHLGATGIAGGAVLATAVLLTVTTNRHGSDTSPRPADVKQPRASS